VKLTPPALREVRNRPGSLPLVDVQCAALSICASSEISSIEDALLPPQRAAGFAKSPGSKRGEDDRTGGVWRGSITPFLILGYCFNLDCALLCRCA